MRSHKSSVKSENMRIIDVSRTVRRRLNMNSIPDVVQTSQYQQNGHYVGEEDDKDEIPLSVIGVNNDEFFLSKNSKLFLQVSSNTFKTSLMYQRSSRVNDSTPCQVVEVKEMEIVKSVAATNNNQVVLSRANFGVQQVPQV
jgi:hypothetical protein